MLPHRFRLCALSVVIAVLLTACGGDSGGDASAVCDQPVREELDPASFTHVIDPATARFKTDPPTSGPHVSGALPTGVLTEPIQGAVQVSILEAGNVIVQYRDLTGPDLQEVGAFAGPQVVVAPNPDLPGAATVVATAWTYKLSCTALDIDAVETFIADHTGAAVNH